MSCAGLKQWKKEEQCDSTSAEANLPSCCPKVTSGTGDVLGLVSYWEGNPHRRSSFWDAVSVMQDHQQSYLTVVELFVVQYCGR